MIQFVCCFVSDCEAFLWKVCFGLSEKATTAQHIGTCSVYLGDFFRLLVTKTIYVFCCERQRRG